MQPGYVVDKGVVHQLDGTRRCAHRGIEAAALDLAERNRRVRADIVKRQAAGIGTQPVTQGPRRT